MATQRSDNAACARASDVHGMLAQQIWGSYCARRTPEAAGDFIAAFQAATVPVQTAILGLLDENVQVHAVLKGEYQTLLAEVKRLKSPPILHGTLVGLEQDNGDLLAVVSGQGKRFEATVSADVDRSALVPGRTVCLSNSSGCVVRTRQMADGNEVGTVDQVLCRNGETHVLVEAHGHTFALDPAEAMKGLTDTLCVGDRVRFDRDALLLCSVIEGASDTSEFEPEQVPDTTLADVGGLGRQKQHMLEAIVWPFLYADLFREYGQRRPHGILLVGPPGCGKTMLCRAVCRHVSDWLSRERGRAGRCFFYVDGGQFFHKYVGESSRRVRSLFRTARETAQEEGLAIILIDEVDVVAGPRVADDHSGGAVNQVGAALQCELDGLEPADGVIVVGTTNRRDLMSPALLRPGRFDEIIEFGPPDPADMRAILATHMSALPASDPDAIADRAIDVVFGEGNEAALAWLTYRDGEREAVRPAHLISGAMIAEAVRRGTMAALRRDVETHVARASGVDPDDVRAALIDLITTHLRGFRPHNVRWFLSHLPDDRDVVAVELVPDWDVQMTFAV